MMNKINCAGIVSYSTIDYPWKSAAVVYLCGCPYRCPWCQNPELISAESSFCRKLNFDEVIQQLNENYLIDAVCLTGGEPLMQEETIGLLKEIKEKTPFLLKIDHNGFFPERLEKALAYLDYLAIDIKAPLSEKYGAVVGLPDQWEHVVETVAESIAILGRWGGRKEARTTVVPGLIDGIEDVREIAKIVSMAGFETYTLQQFRPDKTLDPLYEKIPPADYERVLDLGIAAKEILRGKTVRINTQKNGFEEM